MEYIIRDVPTTCFCVIGRTQYTVPKEVGTYILLFKCLRMLNFMSSGRYGRVNGVHVTIVLVELTLSICDISVGVARVLLRCLCDTCLVNGPVIL